MGKLRKGIKDEGIGKFSLRKSNFREFQKKQAQSDFQKAREKVDRAFRPTFFNGSIEEFFRSVRK